MSRSDTSVPLLGFGFDLPVAATHQKNPSRRARPLGGIKEFRPDGRRLPDTHPRLRLDEHGASLRDLKSVVENVHVRDDSIGSILAW